MRTFHPADARESSFKKKFVREVRTPLRKETRGRITRVPFSSFSPAVLYSIYRVSVTAYSSFKFVGIDIVYPCCGGRVSLQLMELNWGT